MANIFDMAKWFLSQEPMTLIKLQNVCYHAVAWSYVVCPNIITAVEFEAWEHGYACRALFDKYKKYHHKAKLIPEREEPTTSFTEKDEQFLSDIWRMYGGQSEQSLKILAHKERPWRLAHEHPGSPLKRGDAISPEEMKKFYQTL